MGRKSGEDNRNFRERLGITLHHSHLSTCWTRVRQIARICTLRARPRPWCSGRSGVPGWRKVYPTWWVPRCDWNGCSGCYICSSDRLLTVLLSFYFLCAAFQVSQVPSAQAPTYQAKRCETSDDDCYGIITFDYGNIRKDESLFALL